MSKPTKKGMDRLLDRLPYRIFPLDRKRRIKALAANLNRMSLIGSERFLLVSLNHEVFQTGMMDLIKGIVSAYHVAKTNNLRFRLEYDERHSWLDQIGGQTHRLSERDGKELRWGLFDTLFYINVNNRKKAAEDFERLRNTKKSIIWYSNNNMIWLTVGEGWESIWRETFFEVFPCRNRIPEKPRYRFAYHLRTGGAFGDFKDSFRTQTLSGAEKARVLEAIEERIAADGAEADETYLASDSGTIVKALKGKTVSALDTFRMDSGIRHLTQSDAKDMEVMMHDFWNLADAENVVSLSHPRFYEGVFAMYSALIGGRNYSIQRLEADDGPPTKE